jgi:glycosyltransferase involved in cell wall biosynthesis
MFLTGIINRLMKLSVIIPSFYPAMNYGGTITSSLKTCQVLAKSGHEINVSTTDSNMYEYLNVEKNMRFKLEEGLYVKYYHDTLLNRLSVPLFFNLHKEIALVDVVHVQSIFNSPVPLALFHAKRMGKSVLLSPRGVLCDWIMNQGIPFKNFWLNTFIKPFADYVFWHATSEQEKNDIKRHFPDARIHIIPNGIDINEFEEVKSDSGKEYFKKYFSVEKLFPVIVSMGRIHKKKGFDILIKAFNQILPGYPDAKLIIAGEDEGEKDHLEKLIEDLHLQSKVCFPGMLKGQEKIQFLAGADLFVLPSHNENFGNVYAEALAAGTPVIASRNTPWQEVEKHTCGYWVENTVDQTSTAMLRMLKMDLREMGENGKEYIKEYDWRHIGKKFEKVFFQMLNK